MKSSFVSIVVPFILLSTGAAFAFPAHSFYLTCSSASAQVLVNVNSTEADGVFIESLQFKSKNQGAVRIDQSIADVPMRSDQAPKKIAFFAASKLVTLSLGKDMLETAVEGKGIAILSIDNKAESATCLGQSMF